MFQLNWNRKLLNYISCVLFEIVGVISWHFSLCLFIPAVNCSLLGFGEISDMKATMRCCTEAYTEAANPVAIRCIHFFGHVTAGALCPMPRMTDYSVLSNTCIRISHAA